MESAFPQSQVREDTELLCKAQQGDREAFEQLAGRYRGAVLAVVRARVSAAEAEDLTQEVLLRAWQKLPGLRDPGAFPAWLNRLAVNACNQWYRGMGRNIVSLDAGCILAAADTPDPLQEVLRWEQSIVLREALLAIPSQNRTALIMHLWGQYAYTEIAESCGVPLSTVEGRIHRAKNQLRRLLGYPERMGPARAARGGRAAMKQASTKPGIALMPQIGHSSGVHCMRVSRDGRRFAARDTSGTLVVWNLESGREELRTTSRVDYVGMCFSQDGRLLAASDWGIGTSVWDVEQGTQVAVLPSEGPSQFSEDGAHLWIASSVPDPESPDWSQAQVLCWDLGSKKVVKRVEGMRGTPKVISPDLTRLVTLTGTPILEKRSLIRLENPELVVWDLSTGRQISRLEGLGDYCRRVAISGDGTRIAAAAWGRAAGTRDVSVWDADTGKLIHVLTGHEATVGGLDFGPDAGTLASATLEGDIFVWDLATGEQRRHFEQVGRIDTLAFTADGQDLLSVGPEDETAPFGSASIILRDLASGNVQRVLSQHAHRLRSVAFSPDGHTLAIGGEFPHLPLWDLNTGRPSRCLQTGGAMTDAVAFHPTGERMLACTDRPDAIPFTRLHGQALLWDLGSDEPARIISDPDTLALSADFARDGARAAVGINGHILIFDTASWRVERTLESEPGWLVGGSADFSPDGTKLATEGHETTQIGGIARGALTVWDIATGEIVRRWIEEDRYGFHSHAFSPDGRTLAAAMGSNARLGETMFEIRVLDVSSGEEITRLDVPSIGRAMDVSYSPDGSLLASSTWSGEAILWDVSMWRRRLSFRPHSGAARIAFSPDGHWLASASIDGFVKLWSVAHLLKTKTPRESVTLAILDDGTQWLAYTPDGHYDCSPGAEPYLLWRKGSDFLTNAPDLHRPGLVAQTLGSDAMPLDKSARPLP